MASLTGTKIKNTYDSLLKTTDSEPLGGGVRTISDGLGNESALRIASTAVSVAGTLNADGDVTLQSDLSLNGKLYHTSDDNTYFNFPIVDNIELVTGGTQRLLVTNDEVNVANDLIVGEATTLGTSLSVGGNYFSENGDISLTNGDLTVGGTIYAASNITHFGDNQTNLEFATGQFKVNTGGLARLSVTDSSTQVTNPLIASSSLAVSGAATFSGALNGTLSTAAQTNITSVGTLISLAVSGNAAFDTNTLFVDAANNRVGIGTDNPSAALTIKGTTPFIRIERDGVQTWQIQNNTLVVNNGLSFNNITNGTTPLFLDASNDNVGIGTSSPVEKLTINGTVGFQQSGTQTYHIAPSGGNLIFVQSGVKEIMSVTANGLTFNGDTSSANALDDYEEGTWTMGIAFGGASAGVTYSSNTGSYTKIGRQVTVNGRLTLTSKGSSTGIFEITGLPFTIGSENEYNCAASLGYLDNISFADWIGAWGVNGTTVIKFRDTTAGVQTDIDDTNIANNSGIIFSLTYFV
jgi:hypothetical protein